MTATMRAVVLDAPGSPEALGIRELPVPEPRPGWVLIRVKAFGINRSELHTRLGLAQGVTLPARARHRGHRRRRRCTRRRVPGRPASRRHEIQKDGAPWSVDELIETVPLTLLKDLRLLGDAQRWG
jgi:hypothetical protein